MSVGGPADAGETAGSTPGLARRGARVALAVIALWLGAVGVGLALLGVYESRPGEPAAAPARWPAASGLVRAADRATLLMLIHPRCPCSRASLEELDRVMARVGDRLTAHVLFVAPSGASGDWTDGDLEARAAAIRGVTVARDPDGREARLFHAWTSGETMLYDAAGHLVFAGGLTGARGHAGNNGGEDAVMAALLDGSGAVSAPVFGCALRRADETPEDRG